MQSLDDIIATEPHAIRAVFISDIHLSKQTSKLMLGFLALIARLNTLPKLQHLYILGDWLDAWAGDDDYLNSPDEHWLHPAIMALKLLSARTHIHLIHGNRDFAIRQDLCHAFGGVLIDEPHRLVLDPRIRLEHGDALCSDDVSYQKFRRIIRHPLTLKLLFALPLSMRKKIAGDIKTSSQSKKQQKPSILMDVNDTAVAHALQQHDALIHGHTHRSAMHQYTDNKKRLVLGDWRYEHHQCSAVIGLYLSAHGTSKVSLVKFNHHI